METSTCTKRERVCVGFKGWHESPSVHSDKKNLPFLPQNHLCELQPFKKEKHEDHLSTESCHLWTIHVFLLKSTKPHPFCFLSHPSFLVWNSYLSQFKKNLQNQKREVSALSIQFISVNFFPTNNQVPHWELWLLYLHPAEKPFA